MSAAGVPSRSVIALSWRRAELSGLEPTATVDNPRIEEFDRCSRLTVAAAPVLDEMARVLAGTRFAVILADRAARLVDMRFGQQALRPRLESVGAAPGSRFVEATTGTNSIATAFELRRGIAVHGEEHFLDTLKRFSCYGHPILHPVTRRLEGIVDITCLVKDDNPLLAPFLVRAAKQIEERLLAGSRDVEQRMLAEFQRAQLADRTLPVVALGEDLFLANVAATELLDAADHAVLRGLAVEVPAERTLTRQLTLSTGKEVAATLRRGSSGSGAVFTFEPVVSRHLAIAPRQATAPVLIHGEAGSGRTTMMRKVAAGDPLVTVDGAELPELGEQSWLARLDEYLATAPLVGIEAIHVLPDPVARRVTASLLAARGGVLLTSSPASQLSGEHAGLVASCVDRIELKPLRHRRDEIPALVRSMLADLGASKELRFTPSALEALAGQPWPGNLRELRAVVGHVLGVRSVGDVTVHDLPVTYQIRSRLLTPIELVERDAIADALRACGGNKKEAARRLGISRTTLYNAIRVYGIVPPVSRS